MNDLTAAGGWYHPAPALIAEDLPDDFANYLVDTSRITLPEFQIPRGGIKFEIDISPEAVTAREKFQQAVNALIRRILKAQTLAINEACFTAALQSFDVHLYRPPYSHDHADGFPCPHIGIGFTPMEYAIPTIHEHLYDATYDWDD